MNTTATRHPLTCAVQWIIANTVAWTLAMVLGVLLGDAGSDSKTLWLVWGGCLIGAAEWLVLSRRFPISGLWAVGFGLGWSVALKTGWHFGFFAPDVRWLGGTGGVLVGVQQWLALRRHVSGAIIWLPAFTASSFFGTWAGEAAGWAYYNHTSDEGVAYVIGGACVGAAIGLLSSAPLVRLLRMRN
jgi:hypothetical protein